MFAYKFAARMASRRKATSNATLVASIFARVWDVACHRRNDDATATDPMHDAIMIMHFKKYDKLGVARATTIIFHSVTSTG